MAYETAGPEEDEDDDERCYGKVACIRIERQGEFGLSPDLFRIQTRLPLRPSTNMSHTTYVKHTGYQVNIIHHENHVTGNNKQYNTIHMSVSYSTPKPHGWQRDPMRNRRHLRGWVGGKLRNGGTLGAGPKVSSAELSAFEQAVRTPMPTRAVPQLRLS